ncbi:toll/interleukin-1 receptor domain-containing protein [Pseudomonas chlororaphis]|uniref:toll/interleukin-1 receptor domain-containing protein n=1 Tax=Pseudomonas chlororaphis TaxID=587753 RepID=UPI000F57702D|nr:toll/interleukin-1 receptor domain-containing protein [Pseudomonas chlororaphis]AZC81786.1 hypothetical protein C4K30_2672 [Pseudomonas chlororaphis subsp. piscium]AZC88977.1 hypothetical protein C4K29_2676 [Pseudomonas chlororaphis subsp. piscium]
MKVFISWSGKRSKALAIALKDWIPLILQYAKPWVSDKDISGGDRWAQAVSSELETSNFGILCITPENLTSEWILFEAGALSKSMLDAKVIPLLWGLELSDLSGPLAQFQALKVDQNGMLSVAKAINAVAENKATDTTVEQLVPALWPQLQQKLDAIPDKEASDKHMRPQTEILEDLVSQVRGLGARMRDFDPELLDRDMRNYNMRYRDNDPRMIDEMMHMLMARNNDMSLLILAGFVRDRMPWLAEVLVEAHRDLKTASPEQARDIAQNIMGIAKITSRGPLSELMMETKSGKRLIMELPHYIDRALSIRLTPRNMLDESDPDDGSTKNS